MRSSFKLIIKSVFKSILQMTLTWLKRVLICSATITGGCYMSLQPGHRIIHFNHADQEESQKDENVSSYIYLPEISGWDFDESLEANSTLLRKNNLPTYWKLLMLSESKNQKVRHKAIESLSKLTLEKWQYIMVAQACNINTSVGLARSFNANLHFFLPPPFRDLDMGNVQNELYLMLSSLQFSNMDICIQNLVKQVVKSAKFLLKNGYHVDLEVGDPSVIYHSQQKQKAVFLYDKLCLETILACSLISSLRDLMMEKGILKLLLKVLHSHKKDTEIHSLIAQILSNLAVEEKFQSSIYMTGWIRVLSEWNKSPYITVNLPAVKALANLDTDDLSHPIYEDGVYLLNPLSRLSERNISADVIFIHGLLGTTFWTWRQSDTQKNKFDSMANSKSSRLQYTMCWPKDWLAADIPTLRIISLDYKSSVSKWRSSCPDMIEKDNLDRRASELMNKLLLSNVGERPIIWVAHSMGGLIVKKILAEAFESKEAQIQSLVKNTVGMIFYSVPHKGSEIVDKINSASLIFQPSSDVAELTKDSPSLLSLHDKFKDITSEYDIPVLSFGETKKSYWGLNKSILVPSDSADPGIGEFHLLPVDHLSTCKPVSPESPEYLQVLHFLKDKTNRNKITFFKRSDIMYEISKLMSLIP